MWTTINRLSITWKFDLSNKIKRDFFQIVLVSILSYGCSTWTLTTYMEKKQNGNYLRMLHDFLNKSWKQYSHLHHISKSIQTRPAKCCWINKDRHIRNILQWILTHRLDSVCQLVRIFLHQLCGDNGRSLVNPLGTKDDWDWRRKLGKSVLSVWLDDDDHHHLIFGREFIAKN